jgi:YhcH/YjgK/YiaL family protein
MVPPELRPVFAFLEENSEGGLDDGRHQIEGSRAYAQAVVTWPKPPCDCQFEAHPNHIEVMYLTAGAEMVGYAPEDRLGNPLSHDRIAGTVVYGDPQEYVQIQLRARDLVCVFYPEDGHFTSCRLDGDAPIHRIEIRMAADMLEQHPEDTGGVHDREAAMLESLVSSAK